MTRPATNSLRGAGPTSFKDYAPGILVTRRPDDGRPGGVSSLSTGSRLPTDGQS